MECDASDTPRTTPCRWCVSSAQVSPPRRLVGWPSRRSTVALWRVASLRRSSRSCICVIASEFACNRFGVIKVGCCRWGKHTGRYKSPCSTRVPEFHHRTQLLCNVRLKLHRTRERILRRMQSFAGFRVGFDGEVCPGIGQSS
jgi:hypothetical protein